MLSKPKPPPPNLSDETLPKESRTGWTPLVCKKGELKQIRIVCQRSNGHKNLFSSSPAATKNRPNWAPIYDCELSSEEKKGVVLQRFNFVNCENEMKSFRADLLNPFIYGLNPFTQKCSQIVVDNNLLLLGKYYSLTSKSEGYYSHTDDFDRNGFSVTETGLKEKDIIDAGGSLEDLTAFQKLADENAFEFGTNKAEDKDFKLSALNKRKITDFFIKESDPKKKVNKMNKTERTEAKFREEIESENGLEKSLVNSYAAFKYVNIDRLAVSPNLFLMLNEAKVRDIADSIATQPDPSQLILTVCPQDIENVSKTGNIDDMDFFVIAGQHRLQALKLLDRQGKLNDIACIKNRKIPCFVCKTDSAAGANFTNIRNNDISSKFKATASNEDLVLIFAGLSKTSLNQSEAVETVRRICYSRKTASEDVSALTKIIEWPNETLEKLTIVLECFKKFKTLDATGYGVKARLKNRETKTLTKAQFRQLGRCKPGYFLNNCDKVVKNEISLKQLLTDSQNSLDLEKAALSLSQAAGHEDFESLKQKYPNRFDEKTLQKFVGAEVCGKKKNVQGVLLKNYLKQVKEGGVVKEPVSLEEVDSLFDVNGTKLDGFDVIVYNSKSWEKDYVKWLVDFVGTSIKDHLAVIAILPAEEHLLDILKDLDTCRDKEGFVVHQLLFQRSTTVAGNVQVQQNITFSVLFGKANIFKGELFSLNHGTVECELQKVVEKLSPPSAKVAYIGGRDTKLIKIHPEVSFISDCEVTYLASKKCLDEFLKNCLVKVQVASDTQLKIPTLKPVSETERTGQDEIVEDKFEEMIHEIEDDTQASENLLERKSSTSSLKYLPQHGEDIF